MLRNETLLGILEVLTVGLPFCVFKILTGLFMGRWGLPLVVLGAADALVNLANLAALLVLRRRVLPLCLSQILLRRADPELAAALDVALSFLLVAIIIGGNFLGRFPAPLIRLWSAAVVMNVLGAGWFQVNQAYARTRASD